MATFRSMKRAVGLFKPALQCRQLSVSSSVRAWNKDWIPGNYPETKEEREAAAKKYGLLPQDYDAYPDDGLGAGDYPKLPDIGDLSKSNYEDYDMPHLKRNYMDPVHLNSDAYTEDRSDPVDPSVRPKDDLRNGLLFIAFALFVWYCIRNEVMIVRPPVMPKQYPYGNLYLERGGDPNKPIPETKHYLFEPAE